MLVTAQGTEITTALLEYGILGIVIIALGIAVYNLWTKNSTLNTDMLVLQQKHSGELLEMLQQTLSSKNETRTLIKSLYEVGNRDLSDKITNEISANYDKVMLKIDTQATQIESRIKEIKLDCKFTP